jgi:hypothetical protein
MSKRSSCRRRAGRPARSLASARAVVMVQALVVLVIFALAGCGDAATDFSDPVDAFRDSTEEYLGPFKGAAAVNVYRRGDAKAEGYVRGKAVLVNRGDRYVDRLGFSIIPKGIRAMDPGEVGTVVLYREKLRKVGEYSDGSIAYQPVWHVEVVDLEKGRVVGRAVLRGGIPDMIITDAAESVGDYPGDDLRAYLRKLDRR